MDEERKGKGRGETMMGKTIERRKEKCNTGKMRRPSKDDEEERENMKRNRTKKGLDKRHDVPRPCQDSDTP